MSDKVLVTPTELATLLKTENVVLIDTRDPATYAAGHLPGAVNIHDIFTYLATSTPEGLATLSSKFAKAFGDGCQGWGAATVMSDKHSAIGWVLIDSMDSFNAGMAEQGAAIMADVANYTNQQPEVVMGEVTGGS